MNTAFLPGVYIHIPFCKQKCKYCDFYSLMGHEDLFERYEKRVCDAIDIYMKGVERRYNSLYFGGGTPLYFGEEHLIKILRHVKPYLLDNSEITAEGNPERGDIVDFKALKEAGVNRLSMGLQSSNQRELDALGRIHTAKDCEISVKRAMNAGIDNISLDLMIGIPYQSEKSLMDSIDFCANLGVKHISAYMLKIEEGTPLSKDRELCKLCADDEKYRDLYLCAVEKLKSLGYYQYEISNFSKKGYESAHNLKYWNDLEYIGIGPGAHSFIGDRRFYFPRNLNDFMEKDFTDNEIYESKGGEWDEYAALRLRLTDGLDTKLLSEKYPMSPWKEILQKAERYKGLINIDGDTISMTPEGFMVSNTLTAELLY